ncbi:LOW QUALITY PROTEIN: testis-expressed protein 30 [Vipera latastei]
MLLYDVIITHGASGDMNFSLVSLANYLASNGFLCLFTCKSLNVIHRAKAYKAVMVRKLNDYKLSGIFFGDCSMGPRAAASVTQQANQNNSFILNLISLPYPLHHPKLQIKLSEDLLVINSPI